MDIEKLNIAELIELRNRTIDQIVFYKHNPASYNQIKELDETYVQVTKLIHQSRSFITLDTLYESCKSSIGIFLW